MTDRIHSLAVVLDRDYRDDDVKSIIEAIKMIKGVLSVDENVSDFDTHTAICCARYDLKEKLQNFMKENLSKW